MITFTTDPEFSPAFTVDYGWRNRVPVEGDHVAFDGTDEDVPESIWRVSKVRFDVGLRGPRRAVVILADPIMPAS